MNLPEAAERIIKTSPHQVVVKQIVELALSECANYQIKPTEIQLTVLVNHLNEMVKRGKIKEKMIDVDVSMFAEVSKEALAISGKIVAAIGNLAPAEMYVLSIHFESAKQNKEEN